jgi:hypothetical protein
MPPETRYNQLKPVWNLHQVCCTVRGALHLMHVNFMPAWR